MIDYNELDKFYTGVAFSVYVGENGGIFLDKEYNTLFYKLDNEHYADVNHKGKVAKLLRREGIITSNYIVPEYSLQQVESIADVRYASGIVKRLRFKPSNYTISE